MVERVAKALFNSEQETFPARVRQEPFDDMDEVSGVAARYRFLARAAIAAMREPTKEMYWAGDMEVETDTFRGPLSIVCDPKDVWRAMIDAALK